MGLKGIVMELFDRWDEGGLDRLVTAEPRAASLIFGRLWDTDPGRRAMAARALGSAARAHPELACELSRRVLWALNDESASNGIHGIAALGEMAVARPDVVAPFVGPLVALLGDRGLRGEILKALVRMAEDAPELVAVHRADVERAVVSPIGGERELLARLRMLLKGTRDAT